MKKILLTWCVLVFTAAAWVPTPSRAVLPLIALPQIGAGFASATSFGSFLNYSAVAVGTVLAYAGVTRNAAENAAAVEIKVSLTPDAPLDTPSGWTPSTGNSGTGGKPVPPNSGGSATSIYWAHDTAYGTHSTKAAACTARNYVNPPQTITFVPNAAGTWCDRWIDGALNYPNYLFLYSSLSCPAGYAVSGSNCVLSNAALVQKPSDGVCTIVRTGNSYAYDSLDSDCSAPTSQVAISGSGNGTFTVIASDGSKVVSQIDQTTGQTTVTQSVPNFTTNTTTNNTVVVGAPAVGPSPATGNGQAVVVGKSSGVVQGTGTLAGSTPSANEGQCGAPGQPKCAVVIDETGTPTDSTLATQKSDFDTASNARKAEIEKAAGAGQVTSLGLGFTIPFPSGSCSNPSFTMPLQGKTMTLDFCAKRDDVQAVLNWFVIALTGLGLFMIGASAIGGRK